MSKPLFLFASTYNNLTDAQDDYEAVKLLYSNGDIGSYDSNIIYKDFDGKVSVKKTEKPTQHGAWLGLAAGAAVALCFPVALPGVVAAAGAYGAGVGAWMGHLAFGTSRKDAKELGSLLSMGTAALIVVGVDNDMDLIQKATKKSIKKTVKAINGDYEEAEREVNEILSNEVPV